jgi:predicted alpha/beta-hydrolase family hydrolase
MLRAPARLALYKERFAMTLKIDLKFDGPSTSSTTIALAHGAGTGLDSPFMETVANGLAEAGHRVVRFEFPYMAAKRRTGKGKPPDREPVLRASWMEVIETLRKSAAKRRAFKLVIGGKSMGGRIASLVADEAAVDGLVCLGYPFHPVGKPERLRTKHLETLTTSTLIVQGTRDSFGTSEQVAGYRLSSAVQVEWMPDGDHSFRPRKSSGVTEEQNLKLAIDRIDAFIKALPAGK